MAERRVSVKFSAEIQGFKAAMAEAAAATQKTKKASEDAGKSADTHMGRMVQSATKNRDAWEQAGGTMVGFGVAALAGVGVAVKSFAEFDKQMSSVQAATHASGAEMSQLRDLAVTAGADTAFSAKEAAQGIEELSKAGVSTKDVIGGGLAGALSLAAAGELAVGEAAEIAASAMTQFKLSGEDIPHIADLLAAGAGKAQGSVSDMGEALNQAGLVAAQTGLTIEETTGGLAAFASAGLTGSDAGTSFKTMLAALTPNSEASAKAMEELGISAYDSQGNFIGLSEFAGQLQTSLSGLSDEQRNSTLETIFGSDAVRAASALYEQGAEGVQKWEDAVNEAGYAASTAALMQNNLAGDVEKLGGSLDAVFLKSGSGANDVLRGLAQNAEDVVDMIGNIPGPMLNAGVGLAAVAGGAALVIGGFLTMTPKILDGISAFKELDTKADGSSRGLGKIGKAAGIAAAALAGLQIAGAIQKSFVDGAKSAEDFAQATLNTSGALDDLNGIFKDGGLGIEVDGLGDALLRLNDNLVIDNINNFVGDIAGGTSATQRMRDNMKGLDEQLGVLANGGAGKKAAEIFTLLKEESDKTADAQNRTRLSTEELLKLTPEYADALKAQATAAGVTLSEQELLDLAMGKVPASMKAATESAKPAAETIEDVGTAAEQAAKQADDLVESLLKMNDVNLSASDAQLGFDQAIADSVENLKNAGAGVDYLNEKTGEFNQTAADNLKMLNDIADQGGAVAQSVYDQTGSYDQFRASLEGSRQSLFDVAKAYFPTEQAAWAYVDSVLAIPPEMKTTVDITDNNTIQGVKDNLVLLHDAIQKTPDKTVIIREPMSPEVRKGLEDLGYVVKTLPDGTIQVTESGTDATGQKIDDTARKKRLAIIVASASTWSAEQALNDTARTRYSTVFQDVIRRISGDTGPAVGEGTVLKPRKATGGKLRGYSDGGQLPATGPGTEVTDGFLGIDSLGRPLARLDANEWIINGRSSDRYNRELAAINAGTFPKLPGFANGGREYSFGSTSRNAGAGAPVNNYNYSIEAAPGLAHEYAKQIADQAVKRSQDINAAYGI